MSDSPVRADGSNFLWLADAPLFIDADRVASFYDAVVRPVAQTNQTEVSFSKKSASEIRAQLAGGIEGGIDLPAFLQFLEGKASVNVEGGGDFASEESEEYKAILKEIDTPQRQLEDLVVYYLGKHRARIFLENSRPITAGWRDPEVIASSPKAILLIDLPGIEEADHSGIPRTKVIPIAAEFSNGHMELIFKNLRAKNGEYPPDYPDLEGEDTYVKVREQQREYWKWFERRFDPKQAMEELEKAGAANGRVRWIAYRLPISNEGDTLHLTLWANEKYHTGDLAYNLIKRGYKHGLRLVGTLKSEPDLNVLAVFEK